MNNEEYEKYKDNFYEYRKQLYQEHPLRSLFFEVTLRCNARCEHCGSSCGDTIQKDEITKDEILKVLEDIKNAGIYNPRNVMLNITGGEPLVRKDLFEIMDYANKPFEELVKKIETNEFIKDNKKEAKASFLLQL